MKISYNYQIFMYLLIIGKMIWTKFAVAKFAMLVGRDRCFIYISSPAYLCLRHIFEDYCIHLRI